MKKILINNLKAVILDLDGVMTDTAMLHARAWKETFDDYLSGRSGEYSPFSLERDYPEYVDGKSRLDGVRDFLSSRQIELPEGGEDDEPGTETVQGLAASKNALFLDLLKKEGISPFPDAVEFIRRLRESGLKAGLVSASRNAGRVLEAAGISDLFDVRVDGEVAHTMGLAGKPAPDIFLEAARQLGVEPEDSALVEDAAAGIEAARRAGFAKIIGIARQGNDYRLAQKGAEIIVENFGQLCFFSRDIPAAQAARILGEAGDREPVLFLDYDGTLTPIVERPDQARLSTRMRSLLKRLSRDMTVAIFSGRDMDDLKKRVNVDSVYYAGSHGMRIQGPGIEAWEHPEARNAKPALKEAAQQLREELGEIRGVEVEEKYYSLAVHFRRVDSDRKPDIKETAARIGREKGLRETGGKEIVELRPDLDWDKGKAVGKLRSILGIDSEAYFSVFIGDDLTDEDGFDAVSEEGAGILVGCRRVTNARYRLESYREVGVFLELLTQWDPIHDEWTLVYNSYNPEEESLREVICALGNGCFVTRAAAPETRDDGLHYPGTYLAGGYNRLTTEIEGREVENEDLVNQVNWLPLAVRAEDGEWLHIDTSTILSFRQELDLKGGVLRRHIRFQDQAERIFSWHERRLVSMDAPHYAALEVEITAENWAGKLEIWSALDGDLVNNGVSRYQDLNSQHLEVVMAEERSQDLSLVHTRTNQSSLEVAVCSRTRFYDGKKTLTPESRKEGSGASTSRICVLSIEQGSRITVEKIAALYSSRDRAITEPVAEAYGAAKRAPRFQALLEDHCRAWRHLWEECDLRISCQDGSEETLVKMRFNIFHLIQTSSPHIIDLDVGVPARGWHGEAYRGHIFWDELFIFPFLNFRLPILTRSLLLYRFRRLPAARRAAAATGAKGAMYPWQSGSDGREETQTLHLNPQSNRWIPDNSHRQRHINSAIAYNIWRYYEATEDNEFLYYYGAEILLEIARFWASIVSYNESLDRYEIKGVMGPDEFHTAYPDHDPEQEGGIDNNSYTNLMTCWVLHKACRVTELLPNERRSRIFEDIGLKEEEIKKWDEISRKLRIVFQKGGIISQFEGYEKLEELDWDHYREKYGDIQRLDRILEAEGDTPNRYKVAKQADVLMLFYLFTADELSFLFEYLGYSFDSQSIPENINYYLQRTSHGSTLSRVVHSWLLARTDRQGSWQLFREALNSDIHDIQDGSTAEGIHTGAMSGTVDIMNRCYTGLETSLSTLHFNPQLPADVKCLNMNLRYRENKLAVEINRHWLQVESSSSLNRPVGISYRGDARKLAPGERIYFRLVGDSQNGEG